MQKLFANTYQGMTVLVTGHTGFKGSWLTAWLLEMGANVVGFSLPDPPTTPSNFAVCNLVPLMTDVRGDVGDYTAVSHLIATHQPTLIFHLAAQPIVLRGVAEPKLTFDTNSGGTVNILEAVRHTDSVKGVVVITTDKVYENQEWLWGYRENDRLGGHDPYSASKAMAELATAAYRSTFFAPETYDQHGVAIATARAGNVIGGGDFGSYRLVPDCMKALMAGQPIGVRNPLSVRPWQHVLEPLSGYLWLGAKLFSDGPASGEAWNFGPQEQRGLSTREIAEELIARWGSGSWVHTQPGYAKVETGLLRLSWDKAADRLGWQPVYPWKQALGEIVDWFKAHQQQQDMHSVVKEHIAQYVQHAQILGLPWTE
ncbi:MAG: CDP-glucose 4,6-dehydratase [Anaerolineales bacterium]|nr:CDP-glucose 4,6-dehydratase [Anaerolineales bacterium]